jgi:Holliday junction resolvase
VGVQNELERLIAYAARAGGFRATARKFPDAAETFMAAAELNSAKAATLAAEIAMAGPGKVPSDRIGG